MRKKSARSVIIWTKLRIWTGLKVHQKLTNDDPAADPVKKFYLNENPPTSSFKESAWHEKADQSMGRSLGGVPRNDG